MPFTRPNPHIHSSTTARYSLNCVWKLGAIFNYSSAVQSRLAFIKGIFSMPSCMWGLMFILIPGGSNQNSLWKYSFDVACCSHLFVQRAFLARVGFRSSVGFHLGHHAKWICLWVLHGILIIALICPPALKCARHRKKLFTLLDLCVSSLRRGHANLLCIVPILTDDPRRESSWGWYTN